MLDKIHPQSKKFVMGLKIKVTRDSKLNDSPGAKTEKNSWFIQV